MLVENVVSCVRVHTHREQRERERGRKWCCFVIERRYLIGILIFFLYFGQYNPCVHVSNEGLLHS